MLTSDKLKQKTCKSCGKKFKPFSSLQKVCSVSCSLDFVQEQEKKKIVKEWNRETKRRKQAIKSRGDWLREAQAEFNKYIRERDRDLPCISCGKPNNGSHQRHASHYRPAFKNSFVRFNTLNVHASCQQCNTTLSGNLTEYRKALIKKIGIDKVEWLERQNQVHSHEVEYLKRIKKIFSKKARLTARKRL